MCTCVYGQRSHVHDSSCWLACLSVGVHASVCLWSLSWTLISHLEPAGKVGADSQVLAASLHSSFALHPSFPVMAEQVAKEVAAGTRPEGGQLGPALIQGSSRLA